MRRGPVSIREMKSACAKKRGDQFNYRMSELRIYQLQSFWGFAEIRTITIRLNTFRLKTIHKWEGGQIFECYLEIGFFDGLKDRRRVFKYKKILKMSII